MSGSHPSWRDIAFQGRSLARQCTHVREVVARSLLQRPRGREVLERDPAVVAVILEGDEVCPKVRYPVAQRRPLGGPDRRAVRATTGWPPRDVFHVYVGQVRSEQLERRPVVLLALDEEVAGVVDDADVVRVEAIEQAQRGGGRRADRP